jgi:hypothetical protein
VKKQTFDLDLKAWDNLGLEERNQYKWHKSGTINFVQKYK